MTWYCWLGGQADSTCQKTSVYTEYRIRHFKSKKKNLLEHNQITILEFSHVHFTQTNSAEATRQEIGII